MLCRFEIKHKKGTELFISDTLSRYCILNSNFDLPEFQMEIHLDVPMIESKTTKLIQPVKGDKELNLLIRMIQDGWPEK